MKLSFKSLSLKSLSLGSTSLGSLSLQSLPETLAALSPRERRMVIFGAVALIAILIFGLLIPLDRSVAHTQQRLAKKRADLSWMQTVAPQIAVLPPPSAANGESLLVIVDRSARESGLAGSLAGSEPGAGAAPERAIDAPTGPLGTACRDDPGGRHAGEHDHHEGDCGEQRDPERTPHFSPRAGRCWRSRGRVRRLSR